MPEWKFVQNSRIKNLTKIEACKVDTRKTTLMSKEGECSRQGDQIGLIFANWVIVLFWAVFLNAQEAKIFRLEPGL
jgi:hypothetical protein